MLTGFVQALGMGPEATLNYDHKTNEVGFDVSFGAPEVGGATMGSEGVDVTVGAYGLFFLLGVEVSGTVVNDLPTETSER